MTRIASSHLPRAAVFAAAIGLALSAAMPAQAFTFQDADGSADGRSGFKDLDIPKVPNTSTDSRYNGGDRNTQQQGNTTFRFGAQPSFNQKYDPSNLFNPYYRDGR